MEEAYENIFNEIIDFTVSSLCFSIHRAVKMKYFSDDEYILKDNEFETYSPSSDVGEERDEGIFKSSKKSSQITCPCCFQKKVEVTSFMRHLNSCMKSIRRQSGRNASKRINMDANRLDDFFDDYDNFSDEGSSYKRSRKKVGKNSRAAKLKAKNKFGDTTAVIDLDPVVPDVHAAENLVSEKMKEKLGNGCVSKRTKKVCPTSLKSEDDKKHVNDALDPEEVDVESALPFWGSRSPSPSGHPSSTSIQAGVRSDGLNFHF